MRFGAQRIVSLHRFLPCGRRVPRRVYKGGRAARRGRAACADSACGRRKGGKKLHGAYRRLQRGRSRAVRRGSRRASNRVKKEKEIKVCAPNKKIRGALCLSEPFVLLYKKAIYIAQDALFLLKTLIVLFCEKATYVAKAAFYVGNVSYEP